MKARNSRKQELVPGEWTPIDPEVICPADAPSAERSSEPPQSEPGTEQAPSSDGLAAILSALTLISHQLDTVIEQQDSMISLLEGEIDPEGDDLPQTDMAGNPL